MPLPFAGTLRPHPSNPRYFTDDSERAVYLTGSHTWANVQETASAEGDPPFPFDEYLEFLTEHNHNFVRLWTWHHPERASWQDEPMYFYPLPWARTGPGQAADGKPKFDLESWDPSYFERLRTRAVALGQRGIYVSVMLFQGWSLSKTHSEPGNPYPFHPFNGANNINGIDMPYAGTDDDVNPTFHSMHNPQLLAKQEEWVHKVVDTVNDLDHVLYEIINEGGSTEWQYHIIDLVNRYQETKPKQHPVGMTHRVRPFQTNEALFKSPADWISPTSEPNSRDFPGAVPLVDYREDPPVADGRKVMLVDTDHFWGHGGNSRWVWKSFTRGHNPIFMDPWWPLYVASTPEITPWAFTGGIAKDDRDYPDWAGTRLAMGDTLRYAERMNLAAMTPRPDLASTRFCLANPGEEYLVYLPDGGDVTLNVGVDSGPFDSEWFIPQTRQTYQGVPVDRRAGYVVSTAPYTGDAVLYLRATEPES